MVSIVIAIIGLGLLVVLHEGGHFLAARWCGMRVERFSIGFGPTLLGFKRGDTLFQIAPIPLGGFVQITGLNPHEEFDKQDPYVYPNRPRWMRLFTVVAGPLANFLTAMLVVLVVFSVHGAPVPSATRVLNVVKDSPAAAGGLLAEDVILEANGRPVNAEHPLDEHIRTSNGAPLAFKVLRKGQPVDVTVTPKLDGKVYRIGVGFGNKELKKVPLPTAIKLAVVYPYEQSAVMLGQLWNVVTFKAKADVSGPIGIVKEMRKSVDSSMWDFLGFIAFLSVVLGVINLLPLPGLDGGRALFLLLAAAIRRQINPRVEAAVHTVGVVLLLGLLVVVSFKDLGFFGKG
jgi:regulator of sigma E protease